MAVRARSVPGLLSVVIPAFNEVDFLPTTLARVVAAPAHGWRKEIVVVDDGSADGTADLLAVWRQRWEEVLISYATRLGIALDGSAVERTTLKVLRHRRNRGKGAAVRTALEVVTGDVVLVQDADLEYDPAHFERLMAPILEGHADAVFGSRFLGYGARRVLYFRHAIANWLLTLISNVFTDLNLTDVMTGYKVVRADLLKTVNLVSDRFGFEVELVAKLAKLGARMYEVPVGYHGRTYAEGKKITWRDGVAALGHVLRFNVAPGAYCKDAGHETLRNLGAIEGFNRHMFRTIEPYLGRRVLEVGAGIGNLTLHLAGGRSVLATEIEPHYLDTLRHRFQDRVSVRVANWDISAPLRTGSGQFDSVVCLNVLEHVPDDRAALTNLREALAPDGRLVLLVPAHPSLFSPLDEAVGHYRRYSRAALEQALSESGFKLDRLFPFNYWGMIGWWLNGVVLRRSRLPGQQLSLFGRLSGPLILLEQLSRPTVGLSWIAVARPRKVLGENLSAGDASQ